MRKVLLLVCFVILAASVAAAQDKTESKWNCPKPAAVHSLDVGDRPNHSYAVTQNNCTSTAGNEIGGVKQTGGTATQFNEGSGNSSTWHGVFVANMENGDKLHYSFKGKGTSKDGQFQSGTNSWSIVGGTGKLKGAKGNGTCTGTGSADGSAVWDCAGTITLAK